MDKKKCLTVEEWATLLDNKLSWNNCENDDDLTEIEYSIEESIKTQLSNKGYEDKRLPIIKILDELYYFYYY